MLHSNTDVIAISEFAYADSLHVKNLVSALPLVILHKMAL